MIQANRIIWHCAGGFPGSRIRAAVLLLVAAMSVAAFGCARVRIDVKVYKGPIVDGLEARRGKAQGLMASIASMAVQGAEHPTSSSLDVHKRAFTDLADACAGEASGEAEIRTFAKCADVAQTTAQRIGVSALSRNPWVMIIDPHRADFVALLASLDEVGRILGALAASIEYESMLLNDPQAAVESVYLSRIKSVMDSQAPGTLLTLMKRSPFARGAIEETFDQRYWDSINVIELSLPGKSGTAIVKDQTGNWHVKAVSNDTSKLLDLVVATADAALRATAAAPAASPSVAP